MCVLHYYDIIARCSRMMKAVAAHIAVGLAAHVRLVRSPGVDACHPNCLTVVTGYALIRKASDQTEGCSGPTRYLLMVTGSCFSQKGENPVF